MGCIGEKIRDARREPPSVERKAHGPEPTTKTASESPAKTRRGTSGSPLRLTRGFAGRSRDGYCHAAARRERTGNEGAGAAQCAVAQGSVEEDAIRELHGRRSNAKHTDPEETV